MELIENPQDLRAEKINGYEFQSTSSLMLQKTNSPEIALNLHYENFQVLPVLKYFDTKKNRWEKIIDTKEKWGIWKKEKQTEEDVKKLFNNKDDSLIAIIPGAISNNIQCIDIDLKYDLEKGKLWNRYKEHIIEFKGQDFFDRLFIQNTPNNGKHIIFTCKDTSNTYKSSKIASRPPIDSELAKNPKITSIGLIEFFSDGGNPITVSPSSGYTIEQGDFSSIPEISFEEKESLLNIARMFDSMPKIEFDAKKSYSTEDNSNHSYKLFDEACKDNFDLIMSSFEAKGYTKKQSNDGYYLFDSSQNQKGSPRLSYRKSTNLFLVYSTKTEFPFADKLYSPSACFAFLNCNGNFAISAKKLAEEEGFGEVFGAKKSKKSSSSKAQKPNFPESENTDNISLLTNEEIINFASNGDDGLAQMIAVLFTDKFIYDFSIEDWRIYTNGAWIIDETQIFRKESLAKLKTILLDLAKTFDNQINQNLYQLIIENTVKII